MQEAITRASPHNLVRVILGKEHAGDHADENGYSRAAQSFGDWRREGIFLQDAEPSLYLYVQRFTVPGGTTELERRGFIALGRIEDYSEESYSAMSRLWRSPRPIAWSCCGPREPTLGSSSCCTATLPAEIEALAPNGRTRP